MAFGCNLVNAQGLRFFGNEKPIAERSSLVISDDRGKSVGKMDISFDLRIDNPESPGYIFYLRDKNGDKAFSLMYRLKSESDSIYLSFTKDGERKLGEVKESLKNVRDRSINIVVSLDAGSDKGAVDFGKRRIECMDLGLQSDGFVPDLYFGINRHIVETASFMLRNLVITKDGERLEIPLNESEGNIVHASDGTEVGDIENPNWLINSSRVWDKLVSFCSSTPTGVAFDVENNCFFSYNSDTIRTYDVLSKELTAKPLSGPGRLPTKFGMNFYNPTSRKIIPYEIYYNNISAEIDPVEGKWGNLRKVESDLVFHHHAHSLCKNGREAIIFGGYGDRMYFNSVLRFDPVNLVFDTLKITGDIIPPRFYAGMMMTNSGDSIYIYGGKGNLEGKQDLGVRYYYDLYVIDLNTGRSKKLWEQSGVSEDRVPARTLIPDADGKHFYAVAYAEYNPHSSLQLYKINIADGEEIAVGDTIPIISEEIATNVALYNSPSLDKIFCVVQEFEKYGETTTRIYSISTPPLPLSDLGESCDEAGSEIWIWLWLCVAIVITGCLIYVVGMIIKGRKLNVQRVGGPEDRDHVNPEHNAVVDSVEQLTKTSPDTDKSHIEKYEDKDVEEDKSSVDESLDSCNQSVQESDKSHIEKGVIDVEQERGDKRNGAIERNSISLFGPFRVVGRDGRDITYLFSPKLKMVFIYILLHSIGKNGVGSADLNAVFWSDKDADKVKNLRNVTINKIRKILGDIDGIELVYEQGLFRIIISEGCFCDIRQIYDLSGSLHDWRLSKGSQDILDGIFLQGKFLIGIEDPVFDYFRQQIDGYIEHYHTEMMSEYYRSGRYDKVRYLSNSLLMADPLSEIALKYGILANRGSGRGDVAMAMYSSFVKDYKKMMGEDYQVRYEDIK